MLVAGIMSGTSLDGIDVAIVDVGKKIRPVAFRTTPYPKAVREAILTVSNTDCHTRDISRLNFLLPELYAKAFGELCGRSGVAVTDVKLIGCHGQTIYHEGQGSRKNTMQIGDGSILAERTGIPVVSDFRTRDMAAGGLGAPLVPYFDYAFFRDARRGRVAVNIGGIANITWIPAGARLEDVVAFDTGPGNMAMDLIVSIATRGRQTFDRNGAMASRGTVDGRLLSELLRDPFFRRRPPKTAGREQYGREFAEGILRRSGRVVEDALATAAAFTAESIVRGIELVRAKPDDVIVGGGGTRNLCLMRMLQEGLRTARVSTTDEYGIDSDAKEAIAFAMLAHETWHRRPSNVPSATGARRAAILGKISY